MKKPKPKTKPAAYCEIGGLRYALVPANYQRGGLPCAECALRHVCEGVNPPGHKFTYPHCLPFIPHDTPEQGRMFWRWKRAPSQTRILRSLLYAIRHGRTPRNLSARIQRAVEGRAK